MPRQNKYRWSKSTRVRGADAATQQVIDEGHALAQHILHRLLQQYGPQVNTKAYVFIHVTARPRVERTFACRIEIVEIDDQWAMAGVPRATARAVLPQGDDISADHLMYLLAVKEHRPVASSPLSSLLSPPTPSASPPRTRRRREQAHMMTPERVRALLEEGLSLARQSRDLLVAHDKAHADHYGMTIVHESVNARMPRKRKRIPLGVAGWWGEFFPTDASLPAKIKGRVPAIIMVGSKRRVEMLELS